MKIKLLHSVAGLALTLGMGVAAAAPAPSILGAAPYQAMSSQHMASVTGECARRRCSGTRIKITNTNTNTNTSTNTNTNTSTSTSTACVALCASGDITLVELPPLSPPL
jgi:hypothetical protein